MKKNMDLYDNDDCAENHNVMEFGGSFYEISIIGLNESVRIVTSDLENLLPHLDLLLSKILNLYDKIKTDNSNSDEVR